MNSSNPDWGKKDYDAVLIGAGIMSTTLAVLLKELEPDINLLIVERLEAPGLESSNILNNAGTGHAANCELNYTPINADGSINIEKALSINCSFEQSLDLWASLTEMGKLIPSNFLNSLPHISLVFGERDVRFLKSRYEQLCLTKEFASMEWTSDPFQINDWIPIVMEGRTNNPFIAATRLKRGTDIDFGSLTNSYINYLKETGSVDLKLSSEVVDMSRNNENDWIVEIKTDSKIDYVKTPFVFIGAGGGTLPLLQKSGIPEAGNYGGFPVSGKWLVCKTDDIAQRHHAKVYGNADIGAPPMSVPHLDSRWLSGKRLLLFGPFAGFSSKFLKNGSFWDLFGSIKLSNISPMLNVGIENVDLVQYLISQILLKDEERMDALKKFVPNARQQDWNVSIAGQRVQIIKRTAKGGILKMGTEVVTSSDGSLAALLGASPGASTAVNIMIEILKRCWPEKYESDSWHKTLIKLIPSLAVSLNYDSESFKKLRDRNDSLLGLGCKK